MRTTTVTLITRSGCHLCDDARTAVADVVGGLGDAASVTVTEVSVDDDADLLARWSDEVPVLLVDDRVNATLRVDRDALRVALMED